MRILMIGNSFIYFNDMPRTLAELTGAEVETNLRGGADLAERFEAGTPMADDFAAKTANERYDYFVIQDHSRGPVERPERFFEGARKICETARKCGAVPIFYATWGYQHPALVAKEGTPEYKAAEEKYEKLYRGLYEAYHRAAEENGAIVADVGKAFFESADAAELFAEDNCHPGEKGSRLAAEVIAAAIAECERQKARG